MKQGGGIRFAAAIVSVLLFVALPAKEQAPKETPWNLGSFPQGSVKSTTISAMNRSCPGAQTFVITVEGQAAAFLRITGPTTFEGVGMGEKRTTEAVVDLTNVTPGTYNDGTVVIRCVTCAAPACTQDRDVLHVQLAVTAPEPAQAPAVAISTPPATPATQTRPPCSDATANCEELRLRAEKAEAEARRLRAAADRASGNQAYDNTVATALGNEVAGDLAYAEVLRRQANDYRELAEDAEQSAAQNRRRAQQWPEGHPYRQESEHWAEVDEANAERRRAEAERLDAEAQRIEDAASGKTDRAEGLEGSAEAADAAADAAEAEGAAARSAYQACLENLKTECARQQEAARLATIAQSQAPATTTRPPKAAPPTPTSPFEPGGTFQYYPQDKMLTDSPTVCTWYKKEVAKFTDDIRGIWVGSGTTGEPKHVISGASDGVVTHGSLELQIDAASRETGPVIHYHCTEPGTFVIYYTYVPYDSKRRDDAHRQLGGEMRVGRILIGCLED